MKMLAVATGDFAFYHDLVGRLKRRGLSFMSLGLDDPVPGMVGALLTTAGEAGRVDFEPAFAVDFGEDERERERALEMAVDRALAHLEGKGKVELLVVGVDPGKRPGLAALGDASLLKTAQVNSPEEVGDKVRQIADTYQPSGVLVRIGDGAPTQRDRTLNGVAGSMEGSGFPMMVEMVDETCSSDVPGGSDIQAAVKIANTDGRTVSGWRKVSPTEGELRELQRRSRLMSEGGVTISRDLAKKVALGEMSMAEAVEVQRSGEGAVE